MPEEFFARKGYNIRLYLPALAYDIGKMTPKVRLDYGDVVMSLAEERYFKPIFDWNYDRGLIYGCDNLGRGLQPLSYLDYFRATSWFTAPGNDARLGDPAFSKPKYRAPSPTCITAPAPGWRLFIAWAGAAKPNG